MAVCHKEDVIYMVGLRSYRDGSIALIWIDSLKDAGEELHDKLIGRLMLQQQKDSEVIFCIDDDRVITTEREMPGVTLKEIGQAIGLEMEYSGENCKWAYRYQDDVVTLKKISLDDYKLLVDDYRDELFIAGVMAMDYHEKIAGSFSQEPFDMDWGSISQGQITDVVRGLIFTACDYIRERGYCFERIPNSFFNWHWLRVGILLFLVNLCVSLIIGGTAFWEGQELKEKIHGYKQQMALLENVNDIKRETESRAEAIRGKANILNSLRNKGMDLSGYAIMVYLSNGSGEGVILSEAKVDKDKQLILKGRADNMGMLVKYINKPGKGLSIEKTQQGEQGDVEFICKGQL